MNRLACSRYSRVSCPEQWRVEQNGITKGTAHAVEDGCAQQESLNDFGLLSQDFFHQIIQHETMAAGEGFDEAVASGCPCMESAANCRPAIQPSVRASSAAISSSARFSPITWLRNSAASAGVKRKSTARSSVSCPRARKRASGRRWVFAGGDDQVHCGWQVLEQKGQGFVNRLASITW